MTPAQKRALFPLRAPRWQTLAWTPIHVAAVAVDAYYEAFFACLQPRSAPWTR
jgi:hypothetical protein